MKLIISTIVVGIVMFLLGWLLYGILLHDLYTQYFGHMQRKPEDMKIWTFAAANFIQAFFLYIIYSKGYGGGSPVIEGFKFGFYLSIFMAVPYTLFTWGGMLVAGKGALIDGVMTIIMIMIASILTAIIHGRKTVKTA
jgi:hypothetical protein